MLLFRAVVLTAALDAYPQNVPIKFQTLISTADHDRSVVDAQEKFVARSMPLRIALAFRKLQDLEVMPIGVAKVEGLDAAGVFVPVGQPLRTSRSMFHFV